MFGNESLPSVIYKYGSRTPSNTDVVWDRMRAAHRYRNKLVEIENRRREASAIVVSEMSPELAGLEMQHDLMMLRIEAEETRIKSVNQAARRQRATAADRASLAALRSERKSVYARLKVAKFNAYGAPASRSRLDVIDAAAKAEKNEARAVCGAGWGCVDDETQILTSEGWKTRQQFLGFEEVATFNLDTKRMEWQTATGKTEYQYTGKMAHVKTVRLDMLLTPNHRVIMIRAKSGKAASRRMDSFPNTGNSGIIIPQAAEGLEPSHPLDISPALAAVLGWTIAEGSQLIDSDGISISQSSIANPEYCEDIRKAMHDSGLTYTESTAPDGMVYFRVSARDGSASVIRHWIPNKLLTAKLAFGLSRESAIALWNALIHGDGCRGYTSSGKLRWRWIQVDRQNNDWFQAMGQRLGIATGQNIRSNGITVTSVRLQPYAGWTSSKGVPNKDRRGTSINPVTWEEYDGMVWCPSTPNTTWVARRNGTIFVTGNSYLAVENSLSKIRKGAPPKYKRWRGDGKLAVQIQHGMSYEDALIGDNRIRIVPNGKWTDVWLRIGSVENRRPQWAVVPVMFHRPIPTDATIKWVYLTARRVACHTEWSVCFVLSRASGWGKNDLASSGRVSVELGWRLLPEADRNVFGMDDNGNYGFERRACSGMRVAYIRDDDGVNGEVIIPDRDMDRWIKSDDLKSIRDKRFDSIRDAFVGWLKNRDVPEWLAEKTQHLASWRSQSRLASVVIAWRGQRFAGDEKMYGLLEDWRKQDKHLYEWERNNVRKAIAWRGNVYRNLAAYLSRRYKTVVVEDANWQDVGRVPDVGEPAGNTVAARNRTIASPGILRGFLRERCSDYVEVKSENTTQQCAACKRLMNVDAAPSVYLTCPHCGTREDQDLNASINLLNGGAISSQQADSMAL